MNDFMVLNAEEEECYLDEECSLVSKGQLCIHGVCGFECLGNGDCPQEGKCDFHSNLCKWSGKLTPPSVTTESPSPTTSLNNVENLVMQQQQQQQQQFNPTNDTNNTSNNSNSLITHIIVGLIIALFTIAILFSLIYLLKKRRAKNKHKVPKIKRSRLSTSSIAPEMRYRSTSKNDNNGKHKSITHTTTTKTTGTQQTTLFNYEGEEDEDEDKEESFEETFAEGAVGYSSSENLGGQPLPQIQSQTVYGNSASSTSMIELQTAPSHLPVLQEHHFMSSQDGYISHHPQPRDNNDDNYNQL